MRHIIYIVGIAVLALVSCQGDDDPQSSQAQTAQEVVTVNVDVILPGSVMRSLQPSIDDAMRNIDKAQEKCTKRMKLNLRYHDEDNADLTKLAYALTNPGQGDAAYVQPDTCHAIIGPYYSDHARAVLNQAQRMRLPVLMPCTSAELQRSEATQTNSFFLIESDITQCEVLLSAIQAQGHKRVALLYSDDTYGHSFRDWFGFLATELGLQPVNGGIHEFKPGEDFTDFYKMLADNASPNKSAALIIALGRPDNYRQVLDAFKQFAKDMASTPDGKQVIPLVYVTDTGLTDDVLQYNVRGTYPVGSSSDGYVQNYQALHGEFPPFCAAQVYDALSIIALGRAAQAYAADPEELYIDQRRVAFETAPYGPVLSDWMRAMLANSSRSTETLWIGYGLATAFMLTERGVMPNLHGASGTLDFDSQTHTTILNTLYLLWESPGDGSAIIPFATLSTTTDGSFAMQSIWNWEHKVHEYDDDLGANAGQNLPATEERWAVVISPSTKWTNYRHQADALAIYQGLRHYGYDDDHIVLIVEDNLADDPQNPFPGQIFVERASQPDPANPLVNADLHKNLQVDYHFSDLNSPDDLADILLGRASDRLPHVIRPTARDNVFFFWSGHGDDDDGPIWGDEDARRVFGSRLIRSTVGQMQYRRMLMAVETCYSGKWGEALTGLPNLLVLTAANAYETSKADVYDAEMRTFLSNAFTRTFRNIISQQPDVTLRDLYYSLARTTSGSHVSLYNIENYGSVYTNDLSDYIVTSK